MRLGNHDAFVHHGIYAWAFPASGGGYMLQQMYLGILGISGKTEKHKKYQGWKTDAVHMGSV
jgi:hypothetical protein